jgi:hypothetical protein
MDKNFKQGDLILKCHVCGNEELLEPKITDGRALYLFTHDDSYLKLACGKCKSSLEMKIVRNDSYEVEDAVIIEETTNEKPLTNEEELPQEVTAEEVV